MPAATLVLPIELDHPVQGPHNSCAVPDQWETGDRKMVRCPGLPGHIPPVELLSFSTAVSLTSVIMIAEQYLMWWDCRLVRAGEDGGMLLSDPVCLDDP